ncbi:MAG: hypothetical protein GWM98_30155 [Nitrospinaceae bacterium]|nr:hypothetical protein [Nitrospinaceae bacterium]NIR57950.1 hypothetical protein [Nitrospinaceae bacterium]NIS88415.1 hypothetical protein [Nitrospinaceae bacterium]NIT85288.1 hypothetical protein [Nitrospinaceae bacterium]NIU47446.1 hypothetical protein [Nitrospinaceae bacterium]
MADKEYPEEAETPVYQRDKTAKEPVRKTEPPKKPAPKVKPKKVFVPKKAKLPSDKPMDYRVRHLRTASRDAADLLRQTLQDFKKDLEAQPTDDPDKEFTDREKVDAFFSRLAKKYSNCSSRGLGGELGWVHRDMTPNDDLLPGDLIEGIMNSEPYTVPEAIQTRLGYHLIYIAETRIHKSSKKESSEGNSDFVPGIPS